jgi:hypothetical protein
MGEESDTHERDKAYLQNLKGRNHLGYLLRRLFKKQDVEIWIKLSWLTGGSIGMLV